MLTLTNVCTDDLKTVVGIIKGVLQLIQILVPIGLIIFGTLDLGKAVIASDEKKIKEQQQLLLKRAIAAALVFLVATLVTFIMGFVGNESWKTCWQGSTKCSNGYDPISGGCKD